MEKDEFLRLAEGFKMIGQASPYQFEELNRPIGSVYIRGNLTTFTKWDNYRTLRERGSQYKYVLKYDLKTNEWVAEDYLWNEPIGELYRGPELHEAALSLMEILGPENIRPLPKLVIRTVPEVDIIKFHEELIRSYFQQVKQESLDDTSLHGTNIIKDGLGRELQVHNDLRRIGVGCVGLSVQCKNRGLVPRTNL